VRFKIEQQVLPIVAVGAAEIGGCGLLAPVQFDPVSLAGDERAGANDLHVFEIVPADQRDGR
jgi:hypothetical protein